MHLLAWLAPRSGLDGGGKMKTQRRGKSAQTNKLGGNEIVSADFKLSRAPQVSIERWSLL